LSGESIPQAPRFSPPGILDLMLFLAGVGITLPFSSATAWKAAVAGMQTGGMPLPAFYWIHVVFGSALGVAQGLAFGALLCLARRRFSRATSLMSQPGHLLLLLPIPYFVLTGPVAHMYWLAKSWNIELIGALDWIYSSIDVLSVVGLFLLAIWMRRMADRTVYWLVIMTHALSLGQRMVGNLPGIGRVWLRRALSRPWFFGQWLWAAIELLQLLTTLWAMVLDLRQKTPRDWLHYVGGVLWALHCALNLGQASCSLISLYWR
jgi:hypothetical protein